MSVRKTSFVAGEYYHIYNRGNSKQTIFRDKWDYDRFLKLLFISNGQINFKIFNAGKEVFDFNRGAQIVDIGAYCLMPNHFHILLTQTGGGNISKFMQKLSTGYSMYFNKKYERTGTLFEGKFKSEHVDNDRYLKYLFSYIHLNPIKLIDAGWKENGIKNKNEAVKFIEQYLFSSYLDYIGHSRKQTKILNVRAFPNYFNNSTVFKSELFSWLDLNN